MKVLDKDDKKLYDTLMKMTNMQSIDCSDLDIPKSWLYAIKNYHIDEELKND
jgi:hypothetical protein|tara:strand:+ start:26 stop:181 length:156 start_codon:yes stop_codon:yes gene_type:complete